MRKFFLASMLLFGLAACSPAQIQTAQNDQALVQAVLTAACGDPALMTLVTAAVPEVRIACVGGVVGSDAVTAIMNDPKLVAAVESLAQKK